jgi:two-component system nitrate/nitrite response regulator NarL
MATQRFEFSTTTIPQADDSSCGKEPEVTTALICDTPLLRSGLQHILSGTPFVIAEDGHATAARVVSGEAREPALVILAVNQLSSRTPEMVQQVKERHPAARIVVLAEQFDLEFVRQGLEAGVNGFCLTDNSREVLITSLEMIMLGESMLPGAVVRSIIDSLVMSPEPEPASKVPEDQKASAPGVRSLSTREAEILSSLMEGTPNKLIARKLHVTEATVKVHVKAILRKIGAANRTQAAMWAKGHQHD